jgi:outer membrane biosynthesis protein TonB
MDRNENLYNISGFFLSVTIYLLLLFLLFTFLHNSEQKAKVYTKNKKSFLEVTLVERKKEPIIKKNEPKKKEKPEKEDIIKKEEKKPKEEPKKEKKEQVKSQKKEVKTTQKKDLKSLFDDIKVKDIKPVKTKQKSTVKTRLKKRKSSSKKASKLVSNLKLSTPTMSIASKSGEYNEFYGEIQEILESRWNQTLATESGNEAEVIFVIQKDGSFTYQISKPSYNDAFNTKLIKFLRSLERGIFFPLIAKFPKNQNQIEFKTIMKDE